MGMYTGLRGQIKLKDNDLTKTIVEKDFDWSTIRMAYFDNTMSAWENVRRCNFIPNGAVCYMPDQWGDWFKIVEDKTLRFCCSLKNYENEIETFIEKVLPHIADAWVLESFYEESVWSTLHVNGQPDDEWFNTYKDYDPYDQLERAIPQLPYKDVFEKDAWWLLLKKY